MSHTLTQPEEIESVLLDLETDEKVSKTPQPSSKSVTEARYKAWSASYIPPYRAAYQTRQMTGV